MAEMKFETNRKVMEYATEYVLESGTKWETVSKGLLDKGLIKEPWDNFYHIVKHAPVDKDLLLKIYAAITTVDVRTGRDGVHHSKAKLLGKIQANFGKDGLTSEEAIAKAAAKYMKGVKVATPAPKAEKKVVERKVLKAAAGPEVKKETKKVPAKARKAS